MYFKNVAVGDEVYSLVYGLGTVVFVANDSVRTVGFYTFEVEYANKHRTFYSDDGVPNWCNASACGCQTIWYRGEIDFMDEDFSNFTETELSKKKILKLKLKDKLEMKCPSGLWRNILLCPEREFLQGLAEEKYHLFRKAQQPLKQLK